jgi:FAD/FMN-containing dehydrogenase
MFCVLTEADGSHDEAARIREDVLALVGEDARVLHAPERAEEIAALWRWREGVTLRVQAHRGGKVSEDIAVPLERLAEAIEESLAIGARNDLPAASWGHAGDGNLHTTFLIDRESDAERQRAAHVADELFELALRLDGTISGEHGVGALKRPWLAKRLGPKGTELHVAVKHALDPLGLLNPGKKMP